MDNTNEIIQSVVVTPEVSKVVIEVPVSNIVHGATSSEIDTKDLHKGLTKVNRLKLWWYEVKLRFKTASNHFFCLIAKRALNVGKLSLTMFVAVTIIKSVVPEFIIPAWLNTFFIFGTLAGVLVWATASLPVSDEYKKEIKEEVSSYGELLKKVQSGTLFGSGVEEKDNTKTI